MNFVANSPSKAIRAFTDRYRGAHKAAPNAPAPRLGMNRFLYLAETEDEALSISRRAYRRWWSNFMALWHKHNRPPVGVSYPPEIDGQIEDGRAVVGTPAKVIDVLRRQLAESGANYLVVRFAYGDLTLAESLRSLDLFQRHVMPALRESVPVAAE
jgi:alkanesulfonate monooxygenase SsuD/methylene tetrahydromethanopterin reductase-like flavin-dependent oxidoreductase (luciferase family)